MREIGGRTKDKLEKSEDYNDANWQKGSFALN